jgi:hypothetical protein
LGALLVAGAGTTGVAGPVLVGKAAFVADLELGPLSEPAFFEDDVNLVGASVDSAVRETLFGLPAEASGSASAEPDASLLAAVSAHVEASGDHANASGLANLNFAVVQNSPTPVPVASVPLDVDAKLSAHVGGSSAHALASLEITSVPEQRVELFCDAPVSCDPDFLQAFHLNIAVTPDLPVQVILAVDVTADNEPPIPSGNRHADATAKADPTITIDPNFPFKDDFHLVFSPNLVAPISSVPAPEPPNWTLMLSGLSIAALMVHRQRRRVRKI